MNGPARPPNESASEQDAIAQIQRQPLIFIRLAENALTVAESLRDNYLKNTAKFAAHLRQARRRVQEPILRATEVSDASWTDFAGEVVTFIDGGIGQIQIQGRFPILLRVGSYCVRTGERKLAEREQFGYYPVILGDLEGGSRERKDFTDIVRITAELLGGLSALARTPDLRVLMFHGPLVYLMGGYAGHTPFTERDIDLFLSHYAPNEELARSLKDDFQKEAREKIYPAMTDRHCEWVGQRVFEPLSWIAFLHRRLIHEAKQRSAIVCGVVERGELREFSEKVLLERVFRGLREKRNDDYFNKMYGRNDLTTPKALLDKLGYNDAILLSLLLDPGEASESWEIDKYSGLRMGDVALPNQAGTTRVDFSVLQPTTKHEFSFPRVRGFYLRVSERTDPLRVEIFADPDEEKMSEDKRHEHVAQQVCEAARRIYLYSRLLPGYSFPVGLDVADKFAKVPAWMIQAYAKLIRLHLGISLQKGEISDQQMRQILVQAIYMTHRDWLFRPRS